jgi:hypothetical protein
MYPAVRVRVACVVLVHAVEERSVELAATRRSLATHPLNRHPNVLGGSPYEILGVGDGGGGRADRVRA